MTGTTVQYKVFGTTEPEDDDYVAGNAWHCPTNWEPYASATMRIADNPATGALVVVEHLHEDVVPAPVVRLAAAVERCPPERLAQERPHDVRLFLLDGSDNLGVVARDIHLDGHDHELQSDGPLLSVVKRDAQVEPEPEQSWLVDEVERVDKDAVFKAETGC